jgi:diacylglycerol kinase family enzyme
MIRDAGHKVKYKSTKDDDWKKALKKGCEVVAVAGGDGTVCKVARRLVDRRIPIAVLPVGTANNIGHALGVTGLALDNLIGEWDSARRVNFDVGEARGPWGSNYFIEGVGVGLFAETILNVGGGKDGALADAVSRDDEITRVLEILKKQLQKPRAKPLKVRLDKTDLSDDYVLLQALNIRYAAPNLDLAPDADTNDGLLDVVVLPRGDESRLIKYLNNCIKLKNTPANLTIHRGRHLQFDWNGAPLHIDDKPWSIADEKPRAKRNTVDITVGSHSVIFLCPQKPRRRPQLRPVAKSKSKTKSD